MKKNVTKITKDVKSKPKIKKVVKSKIKSKDKIKINKQNQNVKVNIKIGDNGKSIDHRQPQSSNSITTYPLNNANLLERNDKKGPTARVGPIASLSTKMCLLI